MLHSINTRIERWLDDPTVRGRIIGLLSVLLLIFANQSVAFAADGSG